MRTGAEVDKIALAVEGNILAFGNAVDQQQLIGLVPLFHQLLGFLAGKREAFHLQVFLDDLRHFGFDLFEGFRSEGDLAVKIVVKAVFDGRTDGQLGIGVQSLDRLGQNVRRGMAEGAAAAVVFKGQRLHGGVFRQFAGEIDRLPVV